MAIADSVLFAWRSTPWRRARAGVSLHSHTSYSKETLDFIPHLAAHVPVVRDLLRRQEARYRRIYGREWDYCDAWWTPPLGVREALAVERKQIEDLGLRALVSLSDHNNLEAPRLLRLLPECRDTPMSVEWTAPYRGVSLHMGVHNLPPRRATACMGALAAFTAAPREDDLAGVLAWLNEEPDTLIVLNHPYWDQKKHGKQLHDSIAEEFVRRYRPLLHALEVNGLRPWSENCRAAALAEAMGCAVVSGGDRHCSEPNALLNLSDAGTFSEFVEELRQHGRSQVLVMPQYREPAIARVLQALADVMRDNEEHTDGWVHWSDRVFYRDFRTGAVESLSSLWPEPRHPLVMRAFVSSCRLLEHRGVHAALRQLAPTVQELA